MHRTGLVRGVFFAALSVAGSSSSQAQTLNDPALGFTIYASGLSQPTGCAFLPQGASGPTVLLVCEKATGRVRVVLNGVTQAGSALDLAVNSASERGLLGIALDPNFELNQRVYLYYTQSSTGSDTSAQDDVGNNVVVRCRWNGTGLDSITTIVTLPGTPGPNHDGGTITFGPDQMLYGVIGDLNRSTQLSNNSGSPEDHALIFRVDTNGTPPVDNPFYPMGGVMEKVFVYGIRNSFGLEFDPLSGDLWQTENGPASYDEINRFTAGSNSGWTPIMGPDGRDPQDVNNLFMPPGAHYTDPQFSWLATIAPTAIHFLTSGTLGDTYRNDAFVGDSNNGAIYHFDLTPARDALVMPVMSVQDRVADTTAERDVFLVGSGFMAVTDLDTGPDGALYAVSLSGGRIYRIAKLDTTDPLETQSLGPLQLRALPNPFHGNTRLLLSGAGRENVRSVYIYSAAGKLVRVLPSPAMSIVEWDGRDAQSRRVGAGIYYVEFEARGGDRQAGPRLVLVR